MQRNDLVHVHHMLEVAHRVVEKTQSIDRAAFDADDDRQLAVLNLIQVIGESARRVSEDFRKRHPELGWKEIVGMGTKIVHDYLEVDFNIVWDTAKNGIPPLITSLERIVADSDKGRPAIPLVHLRPSARTNSGPSPAS